MYLLYSPNLWNQYKTQTVRTASLPPRPQRSDQIFHGCQSETCLTYKLHGFQGVRAL